MARHYHVLIGLRSCYMPNSNDVHETLEDAVKGAAWWAEQVNEGVADEAGAVKHSDRYYTFGEYECIEVTGCDQDGCLTDDEGE